MEKENIEVQIEFTHNDIRRFYYSSQLSTITFMVLILLGTLLSSFGNGLIFLIFVVLYFMQIEYRIRNYDSKEEKYIFSEDGIENIMKKGSHVVSVKWDNLVKIIETNKFIFMYHNKTAAFVLPKKCLDAVELKSIKELTKRKVDSNIYSKMNYFKKIMLGFVYFIILNILLAMNTYLK